MGSTVDRYRSDLAHGSIAEAITARGKELSTADTVAAARRLFENSAVRVLPVLEGTTYVGAVDRGALHDASADDAVVPLASSLVPIAVATTPAAEALAALDRHGSTRLIVLDEDRVTYVGLVCMRSDRKRLCVDAECHTTL
jgi:CBS-domain-containing membrane protein